MYDESNSTPFTRKIRWQVKRLRKRKTPSFHQKIINWGIEKTPSYPKQAIWLKDFGSHGLRPFWSRWFCRFVQVQTAPKSRWLGVPSTGGWLGGSTSSCLDLRVGFWSIAICHHMSFFMSKTKAIRQCVLRGHVVWTSGFAVCYFLAYPISRHAATASKQSSCSLVSILFFQRFVGKSLANPPRNSNHLQLKPLQSGDFAIWLVQGMYPQQKWPVAGKIMF